MSNNALYPPVFTSRAKLFLWWLAAAEPTFLKFKPVDANRYAIIGATVACTWAFASLAWIYFFSTVTHLGLAFVLGLFMGCIVLCIDRALIKGIDGMNKNKWLPLLFRLLLATVIGIFIAQPALLFLFDKEVKVQVALDNELRKQQQQRVTDSVYNGPISALQNQQQTIEQQLKEKYQEVVAARIAYIAETDGTGGTKKIGYEKVALVKQKEYLKLDSSYAVLLKYTEPKLQMIDSSLQLLANNKMQTQTTFNTLLNEGFLTRIEALQHLIKSSPAMAFRYYLLAAILLLIEIMPLIAKLMLSKGLYSSHIQNFEAMHQRLIDANLLQQETYLTTMNTAIHEHNTAATNTFFSTKKPFTTPVNDYWKKHLQESTITNINL
jgi:hypothetical protein